MLFMSKAFAHDAFNTVSKEGFGNLFFADRYTQSRMIEGILKRKDGQKRRAYLPASFADRLDISVLGKVKRVPETKARHSGFYVLFYGGR